MAASQVGASEQSQKEIEKEKKQEEKERKALLKAQNKILDEKDELFCGFLSLATVDSDGIQKVVKGTSLSSVPMMCENDGKNVRLTASLPQDAIRALMLNNDSNLYLVCTAWYAAEKAGATNTIGTAVEKCSTLAEAQENNNGECKMNLVLPFLKNAAERPAVCKLVCKEVRFQTKVLQVVIEMSVASWMEWKQYRLKFWTYGKVYGADGKPTGGDDKDDDDKKDGEKKDDEKK